MSNTQPIQRVSLLPAVLAGAIVLLCSCARLRAQAPEGFGQATTGGAGYPILEVTTLEDYDPADPPISGSLRLALAGGNRRIHFAVGGEILLKAKLDLRGRSNVTLDGSTAPSPGITLRLNQMEIRDSHNIIIRHLRSRDTADTSDNLPGFMIYKDCSNIWLDHLSVSRASDESIGVYGGFLGEGAPADITLSWNLIAQADDLVNLNAGKGVLVSGPGAGSGATPVTGEFADRVSLHHNILTGNAQRNPQAAGNTNAPATAPRVDIRNNIIHNWYHYGARVRSSASANLVKNIFLSSLNPEDALLLELAGAVYTSGNDAPPQGAGGVDINSLGTTSTPIAAPPITEHSLQDLPGALIGDGLTTGAGALPRDAYDQDLLATVAADLGGYLPTCSQLGGAICFPGQVCPGGAFVPSSDSSSLCCVGASCMTPSQGTDSDGDGVEDSLDNCPQKVNPGQQNSDGDSEGGDACDITVTFPLEGDVSCADPPPTITWSPEVYNRFRVIIGSVPTFSTKISSGKRLLTTTSWTVPLAKWTAICGRADSFLYIKVLGRIAGTHISELSEVAVITAR